MKYLKMLGLAALSAMALMAFASTASATTLEVNGTPKNESITITSTIKSGTSAVLRDPFFISVNTCTGSHVAGATESPYTVKKSGRLTGKISSLSFTNCDNTVTVHKPGALAVEWTSGTNGNVYSENAEVTVFSTIHDTYITCITAAAGTLIGTLTGAKEGEHATMHINASLSCGEHLSTAKWTGTYTVTTPTGLGVIE